jgi:hypothetical protein
MGNQIVEIVISGMIITVPIAHTPSIANKHIRFINIPNL